jgi:hypothetical protein
MRMAADEEENSPQRAQRAQSSQSAEGSAPVALPVEFRNGTKRVYPPLFFKE